MNLSKSGPALIVALLILAAACGQRSGVHELALRQFQQAIGESTTATGASAKTRSPADRTSTRRALAPRPVDAGKIKLSIPPPTPAANGTLVVTWPQWAAMILPRISAPVCANNVITVVAWAQQENTLAGWNPLATTLALPGATLFNPAGIRNYVSLEQGLEATLLTLQKGFEVHGYGQIVRALQRCQNPMVTATAINASDWCRGCEGGAYMLAVVPKIIDAYNRANSRP